MRPTLTSKYCLAKTLVFIGGLMVIKYADSRPFGEPTSRRRAKITNFSCGQDEPLSCLIGVYFVAFFINYPV